MFAVSNAVKRWVVAGVVFVMFIVALATAAIAGAATNDSSDSDRVLLDARCKNVVVVGDKDMDIVKKHDIEGQLRSGGVQKVDFVGGNDFNSRKLKSEKNLPKGESCVIVMLGRDEMKNIKDSSDRGGIVVKRVSSAFPDSKLFWSIPTVSRTTDTSGMIDALKDNKIDVINFPAVAGDDDTKDNEASLTNNGEENYTDFVVNSFFKLASKKEEAQQPDNEPGVSQNSGGNSAPSDSGGATAAPSGSDVATSGYNPDESTNVVDENPDAKPGTMIIDVQKHSPRAELDRAIKMGSAREVLENYSQAGRYGGSMKLANPDTDWGNLMDSVSTNALNTVNSWALSAGAAFVRVIVVYIFPAAFSLDIMSGAMNSINSGFASMSNILFGHLDNSDGQSEFELAHTSGVIGAILLLVIVFAAWKVLSSPFGSMKQIGPSIVRAMVGAVMGIALFAGMVIQSSKGGASNFGGQAANPDAWPAISPAWFMSWGVMAANMITNVATNIVMSVFTQFGSDDGPSASEAREGDDYSKLPSACERYVDSMYDIALTAPSFGNLGVPATMMIKLDNAMSSPLMHSWAFYNGNATMSSANTWCLSLEMQRLASNENNDSQMSQVGQFGLIGRGANYNISALGASDINTSSGYASGKHTFEANGGIMKVHGGPKQGGFYVDGNGYWTKSGGQTVTVVDPKDSSKTIDIQTGETDIGYTGTSNILGSGGNASATMESTMFHAMCFWDPLTGQKVFNPEWNNVTYMSPRPDRNGSTDYKAASAELTRDAPSPSVAQNLHSAGSTAVNALNPANWFTGEDKCFNVVAPVEGQYTSGMGPRWGTQHEGTDLAAPLGTPIHSATDGEVISAGTADGFGHWVRIKDPSGDVHVYGHMTGDSIRVKTGDSVKAGDAIAGVGAEGFSTGPHLHWEIWKGGTKESGANNIDPMQWMVDHKILDSAIEPEGKLDGDATTKVIKSCDGSDSGSVSNSDSPSDSGSNDSDSGSSDSSGDSGSDGDSGAGSASVDNGDTESSDTQEPMADGTVPYDDDATVSDTNVNKAICSEADTYIFYSDNPGGLGEQRGFGGKYNVLSSKINYTPKIKDFGDMVGDMVNSIPGVSGVTGTFNAITGTVGAATDYLGGANDSEQERTENAAQDDIDSANEERSQDDPKDHFNNTTAQKFWKSVTGQQSNNPTAWLIGGVAGLTAGIVFAVIGIFMLIIAFIFWLFTMLAFFVGVAVVFVMLKNMMKVGGNKQ